MNYINISAKNEKKGKEDPNAQFRHRGNYVANKKDDHAKVEHFWTVNCLAGSELSDLALINKEIELIQAQNHRVRTAKTLHVGLTLPEGESLTEEQWRYAEKTLSEMLEFTEYQRVVSVHNDTKNWHLHIAYNMIHPETFKKYRPHNDFSKGANVCRILEKKFGLRRDVGYGEAQERDRRSQGSLDMEAHTYHESFESYVLKHKTEILAGIDKSKDWHDVHAVFTQHDLRLKARGAGLVITQGKNSIKASTLHRSCSKNALESRFGQFKPRSRDHKKIAHTRPKYGLKPRFPLKGAGLSKWNRYLGIKKKEQPLLTWKDYLMLEAGFDPLALALIKANKGMVDLFASNKRPAHKKNSPTQADNNSMGME